MDAKGINKNLTIGQDFIIRHYAGDVIYNINGFIEKNRDTLFQDFKRLLFHSKNPIIQSMWPEGQTDISKTTKRKILNLLHKKSQFLKSRSKYKFEV